MNRNVFLGEGLGAEMRDVSPYDWPFHIFLSGIKRHIAAILSPRSKYVLLSLSDAFFVNSLFEACAQTSCEGSHPVNQKIEFVYIASF